VPTRHRRGQGSLFWQAPSCRRAGPAAQPDIVAQEQCIDRVGDGKDDVKVLGVDQFALPLPHPSGLRRPLALWASAVPNCRSMSMAG